MSCQEVASAERDGELGQGEHGGEIASELEVLDAKRRVAQRRCELASAKLVGDPIELKRGERAGVAFLQHAQFA